MRFYYRPGHPKASELGFVREEDMGVDTSDQKALHAPIMVDRFYEGARATDGTDIGSRRKHREYMKLHNLTTMDDYKETWTRAEKERESIRSGEYDRKDRREAVERAIYKRYRP